MTATDRMQKILQADASKLAEIDAILCGKASQHERKEETRLIYINETARMLGLSRPTVYKLIRNGRIDAIELDGVHRVRLQSVLDFSRGLRPCAKGK